MSARSDPFPPQSIRRCQAFFCLLPSRRVRGAQLSLYVCVCMCMCICVFLPFACAIAEIPTVARCHSSNQRATIPIAVCDHDNDDVDDDDDDDDDDSGARSSPSSIDQPSGKGQSLSRRYCKHSGWSFSCANRTAYLSQGALAVSCKYFKQSKWPFLAANVHTSSLYSSNLRSTRYSSI